MKGIVFTELLSMVEEQFGDEMVETIIEEAQLPHGGAYTAVGTYPAGEVERLVERLGAHTQLNRATLLEAFGQHLFKALNNAYPHFFPEGLGMLDFLSSIHDYIQNKLSSDLML